jgi:hypothetical protein
MASHAILNTINVVRQMTLGKVESINEDLFDVQQPQFNNTIRWNVGHIISTLNSLVSTRIDQKSFIKQEFTDLFKGGTRPSDWSTTPPSKAELVDLLKKQLNDLTETFANRINEQLATPFQIRDFKLESVGDVVGFAIIHEGLHLSTINDLLKVINHQNK